jgi:hypothetical protein
LFGNLEASILLYHLEDKRVSCLEHKIGKPKKEPEGMAKKILLSKNLSKNWKCKDKGNY